jgi:putative hydrolase
MSDDLFSRLFELFNQPGPINWKLAGEIAHHLAGDAEPVDPFAADELRELTHLAEHRLGLVAPFPVTAAADVVVLDGRSWAERALGGYQYLAESLSELTMLGAAGGMAASMAGLQVGSLAGSLGRWVMASFEGGLPLVDRHMLVVGPAVARFAVKSGADPRSVHLWVVAEESAHRALFAVPWLTDHLRQLITAYRESIRPDPQRLVEMLGQDQASLEGLIGDAGSFEALLAGEDSVPHRRALQATLGVAAGYRRRLVVRALGELLPDLETLAATRSADHPEEVEMGWGPIGIATEEHGIEFCREVERRFGKESLDGIWADPERLPGFSELSDPVGWAARVLLTDL